MPKLPKAPAETAGRLTDRKRLAIVQAAVLEFQTRGYDATSMNTIAGTAKVSKRTLYNHFESKEALFDAIIEELENRVDRLPVCTFDGNQELSKQLTELARVEVEFLTSPSVQALARAGISRVLAEPQVGRKVSPRRFHKRVEKWLDDAQSAGCLKPLDTPFAAQQFVGLLRTFAFWPTIVSGEPKPGKQKRERIIQSTVEMFLNNYRLE